MILVIGSRAWAAWSPATQHLADDRDWDLIGSMDDLRYLTSSLSGIKSVVPSSPWKFQIKRTDKPNIEFELREYIASSEFLHKLASEHPKVVPTKEVSVGDGVWAFAVSRPALYLTKRSTLYWPVHWLKNIEHLAQMRPSIIQHVFDRRLIDYYNTRVAENEIKFGKKRRAKLSMKNEDFFAKSEKAVVRVFDHDSLHRAVKFFIKPVHEMCKMDPTSAKMDYSIWRNLGELTQARAVQEEGSVIALERFIIPRLMEEGYVPTSAEALKFYQRAVQLLVTRMASGWFREFIINNWATVNNPGQDYLTRFDKALVAGELEWNNVWLEQQPQTHKLHLKYAKPANLIDNKVVV